MLNLSIFVQIGSCCLNQNHILKKQNAFRESFTYFPVIKNTIKWIAFKNAYKSSMIFQYFLYANIPAESLSYAPTFFNWWIQIVYMHAMFLICSLILIYWSY